MRILVTTFAVLALAAVPCAWDAAPDEPPAIAALFSLLSPPVDAGSKQLVQTADGAISVMSLATPERSNY